MKYSVCVLLALTSMAYAGGDVPENVQSLLDQAKMCVLEQSTDDIQTCLNSIENQMPQGWEQYLGKSYNDCVENENNHYDKRVDKCFNHTQGIDRQSCMQIAKNQLASGKEDCKAVEMVHDSLNPNISVNFGWGPVEERKEPEAPKFVQPAPPVQMHRPVQSAPAWNQNNFDNYLNKVLNKKKN